jgi:hypothetical protein
MNGEYVSILEEASVTVREETDRHDGSDIVREFGCLKRWNLSAKLQGVY